MKALHILNILRGFFYQAILLYQPFKIKQLAMLFNFSPASGMLQTL